MTQQEFAAVGQRIAKVRGNLTQAEFAARLGVDRKSVNRWEAGERLPDGGSMLKLLSEFGADLNHILTGCTPSTGVVLNPEEAAMLDNFRHSPKDQQAILQATSAAFAKSPCVKTKAA